MSQVRRDRRVKRPSLQSNGQAQAGAASQLVVNLFFVTADAATWTVKPIAFHTEGTVAGPRSVPNGSGGVVNTTHETRTQVDVEAQTASNAQGQGMQVANEVNLLDLLDSAVTLAQNDPDIRQALQQAGES